MKIASSDFELLYSEIKSFIMKKKFLDYYKNNNDTEISEITEFVKSKCKLPLFPYEFKNYKKEDVEVNRKNNLNYVIHNGKEMYFSKKYNNKYRCKRYYNNLNLEQNIDSPHRYLTDDFRIEDNSVILDLGGAEGIFSLENIEKAERIYIFEADKDWIEALNQTFKDYKKVHIIDKFVSNESKDNKIKLDDFLRENNLFDKKIFIKMDIEGNEEKALEGLKEGLERIEDLKLVMCTYHTQDAEKNIKECLKEKFEMESSKGYMIYYYDYNLKEPYLRKGILRAKKVEK